MPPSGTGAALQFQGRQGLSSSTYAPTGATPIAQIAVPQGIITSGANTNDLNSVVWTVWNDIYTNTISITTTATSIDPMNVSTNMIWTAWNTQITSTLTQHIGQAMTAATTASVTSGLTTTLSEAAWGNWNLTIENLRNASAEQVRQVQERQRQAVEQQERYRADQARVQVERGLAEKRAEKLLQETLTAAQREELASKGFFTLRTIAKSGEERIYRIRRGRSRNVEQVDAEGYHVKHLCAHPIAQVPDADTMIAQKLMLETPDTQEEFLRIANHS